MLCRSSYAIALVVTLFIWSSPGPTSAQVVSGFNHAGGPGENLNVPFDPTTNQWLLETPLLFDPTAPPMTKFFATPRLATGAPYILDATQPFPFLVTEIFPIVSEPVDDVLPLIVVPTGRPVSDWHEQILTPGWEWILPGDPDFPNLFPPGTSLITRNGLPWPSDPLPGGPGEVNVEFPPILPGEVLDIHKALVWVGTPTQQFWGDDTAELGIVVLEYPTPEPSSLVLGAAGLLGLAVLTWRRRRS